MITASVLEYDDENSVWNACWIESVSTNEPLTIATPSTTESAVSARAQLAAEQALECDRDHFCVTSRSASMTSDELDGPSSRTTWPSARKRMRSAIAAAFASCVTMIVVWP